MGSASDHRDPQPAVAPAGAGAGAGIYNTTRTIGSVLGSASIAAFMQSRLEANLPGAAAEGEDLSGGPMPAAVGEHFGVAMAQATLLPAAVMLFGVATVLFLRRPHAHSGPAVGAR